MKIGIIGLKPRQISDVKGRKFNGHAVVFYEHTGYAQEQVAAFVRKVDLVIVMPAHIPKRVTDWVPKSKLVTKAGGISTIISYLSTLPDATAHEGVAPPVVRDEPKTHVIVTVEDTPKEPVEPKKLGKTIPKGRESQYVWSAKHGIIHTDKDGEHRYDILDAAGVGDILRFARPKGVEYQVWRTRITSMRWNREHKHHQVLEAHYYEEYVDLLVVDPNVVSTKYEAPKTTAEVIEAGSTDAEQALYGKDQHPETQEFLANQPQGLVSEGTIPGLDAMKHDRPSMEQLGKHFAEPTSEAPAAEEAAAPANRSTATERAFWRNTFVAMIRDGANADTAAVEADKALEFYRKRFA